MEATRTHDDVRQAKGIGFGEARLAATLEVSCCLQEFVSCHYALVYLRKYSGVFQKH